eukprot:5676168-Prymnesium_polylepis.1
MKIHENVKQPLQRFRFLRVRRCSLLRLFGAPALARGGGIIVPNDANLTEETNTVKENSKSTKEKATDGRCCSEHLWSKYALRGGVRMAACWVANGWAIEYTHKGTRTPVR